MFCTPSRASKPVPEFSEGCVQLHAASHLHHLVCKSLDLILKKKKKHHWFLHIWRSDFFFFYVFFFLGIYSRDRILRYSLPEQLFPPVFYKLNTFPEKHCVCSARFPGVCVTAYLLVMMQNVHRPVGWRLLIPSLHLREGYQLKSLPIHHFYTLFASAPFWTNVRGEKKTGKIMSTNSRQTKFPQNPLFQFAIEQTLSMKAMVRKSQWCSVVFMSKLLFFFFS